MHFKKYLVKIHFLVDSSNIIKPREKSIASPLGLTPPIEGALCRQASQKRYPFPASCFVSIARRHLGSRALRTHEILKGMGSDTE